LNRFEAVLLSLILSSVFALGCSPDTPVATVIPKSSAPPIKSIPNVEFQSWSKHPVGTRVVREKVMANDVGKTVVTTSLELKDVKADAVVVSRQITVERTTDKTVNQPEDVTYAAVHSVPADMEEALFQRPVPEAKPLGTEAIESEGRTYQADIFEWKSMLESGPMPVKGWFSNDFPGRQIRLEFRSGADQTFYEETKSIVIPKSTDVP
jgi:hypothetical protein